MKAHLVSVVVAGGVALSGCAPERFSKPVASFSNSQSEVAKAWDASLDLYAGAERDLRNRALFDKRRPVEMAATCETDVRVEDDAGTRLAACQVVEKDGKLVEPGAPFRLAKPGGEIMKLISDYAKGLEKLTSAESRKEIDDATDTVAGGLSGALTVAGQPQFALAAAAAVKLGGFAYAEFFEARRYRALVRAVDTAETYLPVLAGRMAEALQTAGNARIRKASDLGARYAKVAGPGSPGRETNFYKAVEQATLVENIQRADARATVDAMLRAHKELAVAIRENKGQTKALVEALGEFASRADTLQKAVDGIGKEKTS